MTNTGGLLPADAVRRLRTSQPPRLYLMYGLTEAFRSAYLDPAKVDEKPGSIGGAIPGAELLVVREDGTECEPGEIGELVHRGPTVALGYWDDPVLTERVYRPNPLLPPGAPSAERVVFSGDYVRRDPDGDLFFVGRRDTMIKTLGYRVSPDEIVDVLHASGEVSEAVVAPEPDESKGNSIVALVVLRRRTARSPRGVLQDRAAPLHATGTLRSANRVGAYPQRQVRRRRNRCVPRVVVIPDSYDEMLVSLERFEEIRRRVVRLGPRLCDLAYANPYSGVEDEVRGAIRHALDADRALDLQYTPFGGQALARRATADALRGSHALDFDFADVVLTPGAMAALHLALRACSRREGEVIVPTPCWIDHPLFVRATGSFPSSYRWPRIRSSSMSTRCPRR
jgi:hypothetical protein